MIDEKYLGANFSGTGTSVTVINYLNLTSPELLMRREKKLETLMHYQVN